MIWRYPYFWKHLYSFISLYNGLDYSVYLSVYAQNVPVTYRSFSPWSFVRLVSVEARINQPNPPPHAGFWGFPFYIALFHFDWVTTLLKQSGVEIFAGFQYTPSTWRSKIDGIAPNHRPWGGNLCHFSWSTQCFDRVVWWCIPSIKVFFVYAYLYTSTIWEIFDENYSSYGTGIQNIGQYV